MELVGEPLQVGDPLPFHGLHVSPGMHMEELQDKLSTGQRRQSSLGEDSSPWMKLLQGREPDVC